MKHAGKTLLWCVIGSGASTILFGLSKVSVVIAGRAFSHRSVRQRERHHPRFESFNWLRRMNARPRVIGEQYFHRHIDEFGAFESGLTRSPLFGPVISVVAGGSERSLSCCALDWMGAGDSKDWRAGSKLG